MKKHILFVAAGLFLFLQSCNEDYLQVLPGDKITEFWTDEKDVDLALNGIYSVLKESGVYGSGPTLDAMTPYAYQWSHWNGGQMMIGNGSATPSTPGFIADRWRSCFRIVNRANFFLANVDQVDIDATKKQQYVAEATFLRAIAYSLLAETYGGVPVFTTVLTTDEAKTIERKTLEETWQQAENDFLLAIEHLPVEPAVAGRATKGAALALLMRAYLYQSNYPKVLEYANKVIDLEQYALFPSYKNLFQLEYENNEEVIFDVQYMDGEQAQGNYFAWLAKPSGILNDLNGASDPAPTQIIVDAYETLDGSPVNPSAPYENRDPRLDFSILRPGATYEGKPFPDVISNHPGQLSAFGARKNLSEMTKVNTANMDPLNFIVIRYADVLLAKAEALLEESQNIHDAIDLINKIRNGRDDVKMPSLSTSLDLEQARAALRKERTIEFFLEGLNWSDIKRWKIGNDIYPAVIRGANGGIIETKFADGYPAHYDLLPIPDSELSANKNLVQNPGW